MRNLFDVGDCPLPDHIDNGHWLLNGLSVENSTASFRYNTTLTITCDNGFTDSGNDSTIECTEAGLWSSAAMVKCVGGSSLHNYTH